jgi:hypothetical protein
MNIGILFARLPGFFLDCQSGGYLDSKRSNSHTGAQGHRGTEEKKMLNTKDTQNTKIGTRNRLHLCGLRALPVYCGLCLRHSGQSLRLRAVCPLLTPHIESTLASPLGWCSALPAHHRSAAAPRCITCITCIPNFRHKVRNTHALTSKTCAEKNSLHMHKRPSFILHPSASLLSPHLLTQPTTSEMSPPLRDCSLVLCRFVSFVVIAICDC